MPKKGRGEINKGKSFAVLSHFLHATCFGAHLFKPHLFGNEIQVSPDGKFKKFIITFFSPYKEAMAERRRLHNFTLNLFSDKPSTSFVRNWKMVSIDVPFQVIILSFPRP
jgi:hypothetical protein